MWTADNPFSTIKGRYLVVVWLVPLFYLPGADSILAAIGEDWQWHWRDLFYGYYSHLLSAATLLVLAAYGRLHWPSLFGTRVVAADLVPGLKLTLYLFLFSIAAAYLLFLPLSYVIPRFVDWWYISSAEVIYFDGYGYPLLANLLALISFVVLAPVIEEIMFRGILLHRWTQKWGLTKAVLVSSVLFGVAHTDPIGAVAFGIGMCVLYLRTQSLLVPIICHAANNLVVWFIEIGYRLFEGPDYEYTLEVFRDEWYIGLICGLSAIVWTLVFFRRPMKLRTWRLPVVGTNGRGPRFSEG